MTATPVRHLALSLERGPDGAAMVGIACAGPTERVRFDRTVHTLMTALASCMACRAVFAAEYVVRVAEERG